MKYAESQIYGVIETLTKDATARTAAIGTAAQLCLDTWATAAAALTDTKKTLEHDARGFESTKKTLEREARDFVNKVLERSG